MQTEERSQFRLNPQAWVMIGVSLIALGLPVAGLILFFLTARPKPPQPAGPDPQLARALEDISDKTLAPKALESGNREAIRLQAADPSASAQGVARLAVSVGGSALPAAGDTGGGRLWVSIPAKRVPAFAEACRNGLTELEFPAVSENEARVLIEIVIEKKAP